MHLRCSDRVGGTLQYSRQKVSALFVASCVLHNMGMDHAWQNISENTLAGALQREAKLHVPAAGDGNWADHMIQMRDQLAEHI